MENLLRLEFSLTRFVLHRSAFDINLEHKLGLESFPKSNSIPQCVCHETGNNRVSVNESTQSFACDGLVFNIYLNPHCVPTSNMASVTFTAIPISHTKRYSTQGLNVLD